MDILAIGVNYRSDEFALRYVGSLLNLNHLGLSIRLVDNTQRGPADFESFSEKIRGVNSDVICLQTVGNPGYFGGARMALDSFLQGHERMPEWVIVSNVDIEFPDNTLVAELDRLNGIDDLGIIAPAILSADTKIDINPIFVKRPSKMRMKFYKTVFSNYYSGNLYEALSLLKSNVNKSRVINGSGRGEAPSERFIYAPHGSCIIFTKRYFSRGGTLAFPPILFNEEIFVAEAALRLGLRVLYDPKIRIVHAGHVSTGRFRSREVASLFAESSKYVTETYFS
ncbi:MAG: glycosyltransferase family protein [Thermoleophilia bacterium]